MVVVFGDEESEVHHSHLHVQSRVERGSFDKGFIKFFQSPDELGALRAKCA